MTDNRSEDNEILYEVQVEFTKTDGSGDTTWVTLFPFDSTNGTFAADSKQTENTDHTAVDVVVRIDSIPEGYYPSPSGEASGEITPNIRIKGSDWKGNASYSAKVPITLSPNTDPDSSAATLTIYPPTILNESDEVTENPEANSAL